MQTIADVMISAFAVYGFYYAVYTMQPLVFRLLSFLYFTFFDPDR